MLNSIILWQTASDFALSHDDDWVAILKAESNGDNGETCRSDNDPSFSPLVGGSRRGGGDLVFDQQTDPHLISVVHGESARLILYPSFIETSPRCGRSNSYLSRPTRQFQCHFGEHLFLEEPCSFVAATVGELVPQWSPRI